MSTNVRIAVLSCAMAAFAMAFVAVSVSSAPAGIAVFGDAYVARYFDRNRVMQINIEIDEADFQDMIENALEEEFKPATVTVNGDVYPSVQVRTKGNSSLRSVAGSGGKRFSFKINFGKLVRGQTLAGVTQLNLNNGFSDPSYMREFLSYKIFEEMGVAVPAFAYAALHVNGEYYGLYLAVESILEPFLERSFGDLTGDLYKSVGGAGSTLAYSGPDPANYAGLEVKSTRKNSDWSKLIAMLRALQTGEDLETHLDVDAALRYLAVSTALLNFDSYQGNFAHNYYLYEQDGVFTVLPWDLNMSFGGFGVGAGFEQMLNVPVDEPTSGKVTERPLIATLLAVDEYRARYHSYLEEIATAYLGGDYLKDLTAKVYALIADYVRDDPTSFYTFEQFEQNIVSATGGGIGGNRGGGISGGVPGILELASAMSETIMKQLSGELPSTNEGNGMAGLGGRGLAGGVPGAPAGAGQMPVPGEGRLPGPGEDQPPWPGEGQPPWPGQGQPRVPDPADAGQQRPGARAQGGQRQQPGQLAPGQGGLPGPAGMLPGRHVASSRAGALRLAASGVAMAVATGLLLCFRRRRYVC